MCSFLAFSIIWNFNQQKQKKIYQFKMLSQAHFTLFLSIWHLAACNEYYLNICLQSFANTMISIKYTRKKNTKEVMFSPPVHLFVVFVRRRIGKYHLLSLKWQDLTFWTFSPISQGIKLGFKWIKTGIFRRVIYMSVQIYIWYSLTKFQGTLKNLLNESFEPLTINPISSVNLGFY